MIAIFINWDCDLDYNWDYCEPVYSFARIDKKKAKMEKGYYFRYAIWYIVLEVDSSAAWQAGTYSTACGK